ncbi:MAG: HAMP domain-containing histidine kinase, partial [Anaerolineae bacterium]|nr:HAMP domain-containing histidine kinase [Anaerolineae bacterium]
IRQQYADIVKNEEDLRQARDEALAASRFKSKLLANVSHEMRTPLHAIMGYAEILEEGVYGEITPKQRGATSKILNGANILLDFINNLLDKAQLESGKLNFNNRLFAPAELVEEIHIQTSVLAEAKGLLFNASVADDMPDLIWGDRYWLRQLMLNLVSNAIKFTSEGSVDLALSREREQWCFQVSDTGPGIPKEAQARIFGAFEQVSGDHAGSVKGIGLGLSIVKEVTTLMNGEVTVESTLGEGTTFTVTLPLLPIPIEEESA